MIALTSFKGKKLALFGLGGSGLATARALVFGGADIVVWDDKPQAVEEARQAGLPAQDLRTIAWGEIAALVLSPGVPLTHPRPHWSAVLAHKAGVEIIGDIELFVRERNAFLQKHYDSLPEGQKMQAGRALQAGRPACGGKAPAKNPAGGGLQQEKETQAGLDGSACGGRLQQEKNIKDFCPFIAITGTNGKSTTTALLAHILRRAGYNVQMGGNIGRPVLELAPFALSAKQVYVVEISSYQIDLTPSLNPTIGVVLNITPDHIDRHGSFRAYAALKERLAVQSGTAIIAYDDAPCQAIYDRLKQADKNPVRIVTSSDNARAEKLLAVLIEQGSEAEGFFAFGSWLNYKPKGKAPVNLLYDLDKIVSLRGQHNAQNALAAIVACGILHVPSGMVEKALQSFPGLPHRMESVGKLSVPWGEIEFVNDSKATNAEAALPALRSFENIYWIAGGIAKQGGIESLMEYVPRVQKAYLIGEAAAEFAKTLELSKEGIGIMGMGRMERMMDKTRRPYVISGTLAKAVKQAVADAKRDLKKGYIWSRRAVILLAPACASFDQFKNFEERGKAFAALAKQYSGGGRSK